MNFRGQQTQPALRWAACADVYRWANGSGAEILALDAPSGVDTTTGQAFDPAIRATATMPLALPKQSLQVEGVAAHVGELYLADISVPPELYAEPALNLKVRRCLPKAISFDSFERPRTFTALVCSPCLRP